MNDRLPAYEWQPYRRTLEADVIAVDTVDGATWATLSDTVFYPEGGGQPADHGSLGNARVVDVQRRDGVIRHRVDQAVALGPTTATLDWRRRYDHMQQHTAQHVLTAIAADRFGWPTTSFHLQAERCDIELDVPSLSAEQLEAVEDAVADEIRRDRAIVARRLDPAWVDWQKVRTRGLPEGHRGSVRLVDINGLDLAACGGTHLRSTGEIGALVLLGTESLRGGVRLTWVAGDRVRQRLRGHEARQAELRQVLGTGDQDLVAVARLKLDQAKDSARRARLAGERWAEARAAVLAAADSRVVIEHETLADAGLLGRLARGIVGLAPDRLVLLSSAEAAGAGGHFVLAAGESMVAEGLDLNALGRRVAELLDGRGGGRGAFFQGRAGGFEQLEAAAETVRAAIDD